MMLMGRENEYEKPRNEFGVMYSSPGKPGVFCRFATSQ